MSDDLPDSKRSNVVPFGKPKPQKPTSRIAGNSPGGFIIDDYGQTDNTVWDAPLPPRKAPTIAGVDSANGEDHTAHSFTGAARCMKCRHEWTATVPIVNPTESLKIPWLQCPKCDCNHGFLVYPFERAGAMHWTCRCGNDLFYLTPDGAYCPSCNTTQKW